MANEIWKIQSQTIKIDIPKINPNDVSILLPNIIVSSQEKQQELQEKYQDIINMKNNTNNTDIDNITGEINNDPASLSSWDPRLSRVDGFMITNNGDGVNPLIVPFATNTAASAYYNMVFSLEKGVYDSMNNIGNVTNSEPSTTSGTSTTIGTPSSSPSSNAGDKIALGDSVTSFKTDSNLYGVASIVNPYTLTKLCGALKVQKDDGGGVTVTENRLYDIRDTRRFYDQSVESSDDFTSINNPTTTNIITWSNKDPWGRTPYAFQDFVFCKYWNIIPNNRLITFRKYHAPVYDNLQFPDMYTKNGDINKEVVFAPIATVLSYFGENTGNTISNLMTFTTGTKWRDIQAAVHDVTGDTGTDPRAVIDNMFTNGGGFVGAESNIFKKVIGESNWVTGKMFSFGKFMGLLDKDGYDIKQDQRAFEKLNVANIDPQDQLYSNRIKGPVNRIDSTKARDAGIVFEQKFTLTCEYISRPIGGVNTKAAMLDILSNCMEIASPDAAFWGGGYKWMIHPQMYPFKNNKFKNDVMDALYKGKIFGSDGALAKTVQGLRSFGTKDGKDEFSWSNVLNNITEFIGQSLGGIGNLLSSVGSSIFGQGNMLSGLIDSATNIVSTPDQQQKGSNKLNNLLGNINEMWRSQVIQQSTMPQINNMKALLIGEPVGNWHMVVGNPLNPIMTIGNLICTQMQVTCSDELGPDDFPMEIKVTYQIEHAMSREKGSIQSMFNRGNGKIYDLPDYIRSSSDYESKVDNFTGNSNANGWGNPKFMSVGSMMSQVQGSGGYKTYKLQPAQPLAINKNSDNTVITKFTPVDINLATTTVDNNIGFFGSNSGSRVWIRGTAATRKLMN